jgi:uncharacterized protein with beta-barrel porin domain
LELERMRRSPCPTRAGTTPPGRALLRAVVAAILFAFMLVPAAHAQHVFPSPLPGPTPTATPSPTPTVANSAVSAYATVANLGSSFLERLNNQSTNGFNRLARTNPLGGGASESMEAPTYRTWFESYGISMTNGAVGGYVGDSRKTWGGVAGIGARVAPGFNISFSVDQSHTDIDVPLALQSATIDLTQLGFNASLDRGPWTWAVALVHGLGKINSSRDTGFGLTTAGYNAQLDGAISEMSYYWDKDQFRIVPKAALEYVHARTGAFQEVGGFAPISATAATVDRMRVLVGAEVGRYWIVDKAIVDVSAYGKFVDNLMQNFGNTTVTLGAQTITLQGIGESQYGADAGAALSVSVSKTSRFYMNYDAKFRAAMQSHQGTVGYEFKW